MIYIVTMSVLGGLMVEATCRKTVHSILPLARLVLDKKDLRSTSLPRIMTIIISRDSRSSGERMGLSLSVFFGDK